VYAVLLILYGWPLRAIIYSRVALRSHLPVFQMLHPRLRYRCCYIELFSRWLWSSGGRSHQISKAAAQFLQKTAKLAAARIEFLCDKLELGEGIANEVWTTIRHILESNLTLMKDQHLDRIIMCTIYAVCKVALTSVASRVVFFRRNLCLCWRTSGECVGQEVFANHRQV
jgi:hypothetical protein